MITVNDTTDINPTPSADCAAATVALLCAKAPALWTREDLILCGDLLADETLSSEDKAKLKALLIVDPATVARLLGLDTSMLPEPSLSVNLPLAQAVCKAWLVHKPYYLQLYKRDPGTLSDFCSLCWEYLQTMKLIRGKACTSEDDCLIESNLIMAAKPQGWIGHNPLFYSADERHSWRFAKGISSEDTLTMGAYPDTSTEQEDGSLLEASLTPFWAGNEDQLEGVEYRILLEELIQSLSTAYPEEEIRLYLNCCLLEGRLLQNPPKDLQETLQKEFRRLGLDPSLESMRLWFKKIHTAIRYMRGTRKLRRLTVE